jgi:hypothetical protein
VIFDPLLVDLDSLAQRLPSILSHVVSSVARSISTIQLHHMSHRLFKMCAKNDMSSMLKSVHAQESLTSTQTKDGTSYRVSIR